MSKSLQDNHMYVIFPYLDIRDHNDIMGKFKAIMESRDPQVIKPLSRYVFKSFFKRGHRWVSWIWSNAPGQRVTYFYIYLSISGIYARQGICASPDFKIYTF